MCWSPPTSSLQPPVRTHCWPKGKQVQWLVHTDWRRMSDSKRANRRYWAQAMSAGTVEIATGLFCSPGPWGFPVNPKASCLPTFSECHVFYTHQLWRLSPCIRSICLHPFSTWDNEFLRVSICIYFSQQSACLMKDCGEGMSEWPLPGSYVPTPTGCC